MPEELWTEVCDIVQEAMIKTIPKKKKCKKAKWLSEEALRIAKKRREGKREKEREKRTGRKGKGERQRRKGKICPFECRVPKNSKKRAESLLSDQCKEIEEK